jgi:hypothetical protein
LEDATDLSQDRAGGSDVVYVTGDSQGYVGDSVPFGYNAAFMGNWIRLATDTASYPRRNNSSATQLQKPQTSQGLRYNNLRYGYFGTYSIMLIAFLLVQVH